MFSFTLSDQQNNGIFKVESEQYKVSKLFIPSICNTNQLTFVETMYIFDPIVFNQFIKNIRFNQKAKFTFDTYDGDEYMAYENNTFILHFSLYSSNLDIQIYCNNEQKEELVNTLKHFLDWCIQIIHNSQYNFP